MSDGSDSERRQRIEFIAAYYCDACRSAFDNDAIQCPGCRRLRPENGWSPLDDGDDPWLGSIIADRYSIHQDIGRGASATVYRGVATHTRETIAAKIIDFTASQFGSDIDTITGRVRREVEILCRVRNPHVLCFYDYIELPGPAAAIITEYIDGQTLESVIEREAPFEVSRALEIARQIAYGMADVHRLGAIHRDLKPDNILVQTLRPGDEFVHIIDFGIARMREKDEREKTFVGTPLYASPEQAQALETDHLSDIYSLGTILYAMLTGVTLFDDRSPRVVLKKHVHEPAPSIETSQPRFDFAPELVELVASMLAKEFDDRPQSMDAVAEALTDILWREHEDVPVDDAESMGADPFDEHTRETNPDILHREVVAEETELDAPPESPVAAGIGRSDESPIVAISPNGRVATVASGGAVEYRSRFDADRAETLWTPDIPVTALTFAGDNLVTGHADGTIAHIDVSTGALTSVRRDRRLAPLSAMAESADGRFAIAASHAGRVHCGKGPSDNRTWWRLPSGPPATAVALHAETQMLAVGRRDRTTTIFSVGQAGWEADSAIVHEAPPAFLQFSDDGYLLSAFEEDGAIALFNLANGAALSRRDACPIEFGAVFGNRGGVACREACVARGTRRLDGCRWLFPG